MPDQEIHLCFESEWGAVVPNQMLAAGDFFGERQLARDDFASHRFVQPPDFREAAELGFEAAPDHHYSVE